MHRDTVIYYDAKDKQTGDIWCPIVQNTLIQKRLLVDILYHTKSVVPLRIMCSDLDLEQIV